MKLLADEEIEAMMPETIKAELAEIGKLIQTDQLIAYLVQIQVELEGGAKMGNQFSTTKPTNRTYSTGSLSAAMMIALNRDGDTEASYKKAQLVTKISTLNGRLLSVAHQLRDLIIEVRISQTDMNLDVTTPALEPTPLLK